MKVLALTLTLLVTVSGVAVAQSKPEAKGTTATTTAPAPPGGEPAKNLKMIDSGLQGKNKAKNLSQGHQKVHPPSGQEKSGQ